MGKIKHHQKRIRGIHTRYLLIMFNTVALAALVITGLSIRAQNAEAASKQALTTAQEAMDGKQLATMMDSDTAPIFILPPPEVLKGGR
jgi:hypothetical protein